MGKELQEKLCTSTGKIQTELDRLLGVLIFQLWTSRHLSKQNRRYLITGNHKPHAIIYIFLAVLLNPVILKGGR